MRLIPEVRAGNKKPLLHYTCNLTTAINEYSFEIISNLIPNGNPNPFN